MKIYAEKSPLNILKVNNIEMLYNVTPYIDKYLLCHCIILTYIPFLTTEISHREVQSRQTLENKLSTGICYPNCI